MEALVRTPAYAVCTRYKSLGWDIENNGYICL